MQIASQGRHATSQGQGPQVNVDKPQPVNVDKPHLVDHIGHPNHPAYKEYKVWCELFKDEELTAQFM